MSDTMTFGDVIDNIRDTLCEMPLEEVARIHNEICSRPVEPITDDDEYVFKYTD